jgi:coatomer protein complex subunit gamma
VLQECRIFNDANVVTNQPRKCCQLITKLLHIMTQGDMLSTNESTEVFFGISKLFQSKDANLRRMMYLFIKEVALTTAPDEIIIVTASLTKDMNCNTDLYRANSIRVLCKIIDTQMLGAIERYIKQAIVDKNALVASSALVSGIHLMKTSGSIVRRWVNEVQEALNSQSETVQYHALSLLYQIKCQDKLAVSKLVSQLSRGSLRSPLAMCLLIRYTSALLDDDMSATNSRVAYSFLESSLRHKNEMVIYEAARAICSLPNIEARDLSPAITVLQLFLSSPKPSLRLAAVRTLSKVAMSHPLSVTKCNDDMETLISDANRSIATLAITTLLKTGGESSVERLMKQISAFMGEIADEFKIVVVEAIRGLCLKYPAKHRVLLGFLANFLREEGGFEFKRSITDSILELIEKLPETKEAGLFHLCEFIEDCEFTSLSTKILHLLGEQGPATASPARYIRFIYNRVILENATVRASAVSALSKFAARVESLRPSVCVLLRRCLQDDDDEVRDRATVCLNSLDAGHETAKMVLLESLPMSVSALSRSLEAYQLRPAAGPVQLETLPVVDEPLHIPAAGSEEEANANQPAPSAAAPTGAADVAAALYKIPELAELGTLSRSSRMHALTEAETEYVVSCQKHIFPAHMVLQFNVTNTLNDQLLKDVRMGVELSEPDWEEEATVALKALPYGSTPGVTYVVLKYVGDEEGGFNCPSFSVTCELRFTVYEVDPSSGDVEEDGFEEEYNVEDLEVTPADFMVKSMVPNFRAAWEAMEEDANEVGGWEGGREAGTDGHTHTHTHTERVGRVLEG